MTEYIKKLTLKGYKKIHKKGGKKQKGVQDVNPDIIKIGLTLERYVTYFLLTSQHLMY